MDRTRERRMQAFYSAFICQGNLAFDIGANHGDRTATFLALGARVVAVEPQPDCLDDLRRKFGEREDVSIIAAAVDSQSGKALLHLSNNDMVSSLSEEWIAKVKAGGRFDDSEWERMAEVATVTLDDLIEEHGIPDFIKIDTEGSELRALSGLNVPVKALSFEYTPEDIATAVECVERMDRLGSYLYDISPGETLVMSVGRFVSKDEIITALRSLSERSGEISGDVYAVLNKEPTNE